MKICQCLSCRQLPHGLYSVIITILAILAWIAAAFQDKCNYAHVRGPIVEEFNATSPWLAFGLVGWNEPIPIPITTTTTNGTTTTTDIIYQSSSECQSYPPFFLASLDSMWSTGKTLAFFAQCIGGGGSLFVGCSLRIIFSKATWKWTGYLFCLASLTQVMSVWVWLMNDVCQWNSCNIWNGSGMDILSSALWMIAGLLMIFKYPKNRLPHHHDDHHEDDHCDHHHDPDHHHDNDMMHDDHDYDGHNDDTQCHQPSEYAPGEIQNVVDVEEPPSPQQAQRNDNNSNHVDDNNRRRRRQQVLPIESAQVA